MLKREKKNVAAEKRNNWIYIHVHTKQRKIKVYNLMNNTKQNEKQQQQQKNMKKIQQQPTTTQKIITHRIYCIVWENFVVPPSNRQSNSLIPKWLYVFPFVPSTISCVFFSLFVFTCSIFVPFSIFYIFYGHNTKPRKKKEVNSTSSKKEPEENLENLIWFSSFVLRFFIE